MFSKLNAAVQQTVTSTVQSHPSTGNCVTGIMQAISVEIVESNIEVSGDFIVRQQAKYALSCAKNAANTAALVQKIEENVVSAIKQTLGESAQLFETGEIEALVRPTLRSAVAECVEITSTAPRNIVVAPRVVIEGSRIRIGCSEQKIAESAAKCTETLAAGQAGDPSCQVLVDCIDKEGDFTIDASSELSQGCSKLSDIALLVATEVEKRRAPTNQDEIDNNNNNNNNNQSSNQTLPSTMPVWQIVLIVLGSLLLLTVFVLIAYFVSRLSKRDTTNDPAVSEYLPQYYD